MKKLKKYEAGRSMVEMLGVLAIIGVLSVAGIMGYRSAIAKSAANNAMHAIAVWGMTLRTGNNPEPVAIPGVQLSTVNHNGTPAFIQATVEDQLVCEKLKNAADANLWEVVGNCE